jgi:hypothetical protein
MHPGVKWWSVVLLVAGGLVLFVAETKLPLSPLGHQTAQVTILLFVIGLVNLWLKSQDPALLHEHLERHRTTFYAPVSPAAPPSWESAEAAPAEEAVLWIERPEQIVPVDLHPAEPMEHHSLN